MRNLRQIFVAFLLLFVATTAMAQSQSDNIDGNTTTAVRADVNGDGVVNEADIAEIIAIMKNAGGIAEQPKYYWYVGQSDSETFLTTENYKNICSTVSKYDASQTFTVNDKYLYIVVSSDKTVEAIDTSNGPLNFKYYNSSVGEFRNKQTTVVLDDGKEYIIYRSAATANDMYTITIK